MKRTALFLAGILAISSLSGCGAKNSASDSSEPFEGKYVVTADYVKENLDDIIIVDARGGEKRYCKRCSGNDMAVSGNL